MTENPIPNPLKVGLFVLLAFAVYFLVLGDDEDPDATPGTEQMHPLEEETYELDTSELNRRTQLKNVEVLSGDYAELDLVGFFQRTGVRIIRPTRDITFGKYRCNEPDEHGLASYVAATTQALGVFSRGFLVKSNTRFVMLCESFRQGEIRPGGMGAGTAEIIIMETTSHSMDTTFHSHLSMDTTFHSRLAKFKACLHHELYHMADYAIDRTFSDPIWSKMNPDGFRYPGSGRTNRQASSHLGSGGTCFVDGYAKSDASEDKAELFRFLVSQHDKIMKMSENDPCLLAKIKMLKSELERFHPTIDAKFWKKVAPGHQ